MGEKPGLRLIEAAATLTNLSAQWAIFGKQNWRCGMNQTSGYGARTTHISDPTKRSWLLKTAGRWPWRSESAQECVTTHLPKQLALKMGGAIASCLYRTVGRQSERSSRRDAEKERRGPDE